MRINCPHCGPRDHAEFTYTGDGTILRPDDSVSEQQPWQDYVYLRDNPRGPHVELWHHGQGCRLWLRVTRDTVTHEISRVEAVGPWAEHVNKGAGS